MNIYVRKIDYQCINKQISIRKEILKEFFNSPEHEETRLFIGSKSEVEMEIEFKLRTDPRFSNDMKTLLGKEGKLEENDLALYTKYENRDSYRVELIKQSDVRYKALFDIIEKAPPVSGNAERHLIVHYDSSGDECGKIGSNQLIYGVPGCGKSHYIKNEFDINKDNSERVVFHPDYTFSDFCGQILPQVVKKNENSEETTIKYDFVPGPFTRLLRKCEEDANTMHYLVIEEINRGNAPAIFGEIFQLLDRNESGESEYAINHEDISEKAYKDRKKQVKIPSNLTILATMNTADQNVFTLDTAFKRRWEMKSIRNDFKNIDGNDKLDAQFNCTLFGSDVTWKVFATTINSAIIENAENNLGSEDKRLGHFFVKENEMKDTKKFAEKVIMYLWNDVCKFDKSLIFNSKFRVLEDVLDEFETAKDKLSVFNDKLKLGLSKSDTVTENIDGKQSYEG